MAVPTHLTFGTFLAPKLFSVYAAIARHLGERLGVPTRCVTGTSYEQSPVARSTGGSCAAFRTSS